VVWEPSSVATDSTPKQAHPSLPSPANSTSTTPSRLFFSSLAQGPFPLTNAPTCWLQRRHGKPWQAIRFRRTPPTAPSPPPLSPWLSVILSPLTEQLKAPNCPYHPDSL